MTITDAMVAEAARAIENEIGRTHSQTATSLARAALEAAAAAAWQHIATAPWNTDILLAWRGMNGEWKIEVGWAGKQNSCPRESGFSDGWQHGDAEFWMPLPEPPEGTHRE
ncbi:hypothetical protein [Acidomonas methanolica]|uniref:DUF551 domain-containing protein n=1 Tax=Acidomonas methanolica NBRC 104435 TaxID=1231351 RepID=A0A023D7R7_ACIMT|nr:hypothetical protein [Acidomonas methanolica]TCS23820.1 hypothetical protein EDC31_12738 [Acidomonas methanolica]GAJ29836.1 hypothetical protein Amme_083_011 [Acidomonas methanolica NBRC 104435]GBQ52901.1 hypothetical protein AA0498_1828 [Acidomonas methanolica]GEL00185.1 hypothetical protein AME01nite_26830 [Acidomonas methanolica NBRC 104435]